MNFVICNIKEIIKRKGLKQKYVAEKSGFTQQEFSNMMNGRKKLDTDYILPICDALGVQPNDLFLNRAE